MSKRRVLQEELQHDEVAESIQQTINNIKRYRIQLGAMVVLIVAALIFTWSWRYHHDSVISDTNTLMGKAMSQYETLYSATDDAARKKALDELMATTTNLRENFPGTKLGLEARFLQGSAYYTMGDFAKAQQAYKDYTSQASTDEEKARGEISLAYALENGSFLLPKDKQLPQLEQATAAYERAATLASGGNTAQPAIPYLYYYALLGKARLLELTSKDQDAIKIYEQVLKDRPVPVPATKAEKGSDPMMQMLLDQLTSQQAQMSFQTTAKLRLERLKATPAGPAQTTAKATAPQPAAKPAPVKK